MKLSEFLHLNKSALPINIFVINTLLKNEEYLEILADHVLDNDELAVIRLNAHSYI